MYTFALTFLMLITSCVEKRDVHPGIYHYYDEKETSGLVSKTIRIKEDKTFYLFGVRLNPTTIDSFKTGNYKYVTYISYGDWLISENYLILNSNNEYLDHSADIYQLEDTIYTQMRIANYATVVPNLENDSFFIEINVNVLKEVKTGLRLPYVKK